MFNVGDKFGSYRLERQIGTGGFAEVWLGKHELMHNEAAIKILHLALPTPEEGNKFLDEARHLAGFSHPNIVRVMECGIENEIPFLVLEYAPNGTLRTRHPKGTRLFPQVILDYVKQIAEGLQYAHNRRLIHRDVKPENILIGKNNQILVSDFGIAAIEKTSTFRRSLQQQQPQHDILGTLGYMAPEQYDGNPSTASDQYALAVVVYEWLCGTLPFRGKPVEIRTQQKMKPPQLRDKVPGISPALEQVVLKALSEDLQARFRDMETFADALEQAVRNPNTPFVLAQGNPINPNPFGTPGLLFPNDPWSSNPQGEAKNVAPPIGGNNANANANNGNIGLGANPFGDNIPNAETSPYDLHNANTNNPIVGVPPFDGNIPNANNAFGASPFVGNTAFAPNPPPPAVAASPAPPPPSPREPEFYNKKTEMALPPGASPFQYSPPGTQVKTPPRRTSQTRVFEWRNVWVPKNRLFVLGGGFIDFLLAVALGFWLNDGAISWNLWLVSFLTAWIVRTLCAGVAKKYLAIPLAVALAFYWFLGSWAFWTALNVALHTDLIPPHIVAILVGVASAVIHIRYASKKK